MVFGFAGFLMLLVCNTFGAVLDFGIDPAHLGKGDCIYYLSTVTNQLGGNVPGVTDLASLLTYERNQGMNFLIVKAGDGATNFPDANAPQFTSNLVASVHAVGLKIFGLSHSFGTNPAAEINLITNALNLGADGYVIETVSEWDSLSNSPAAAVALLSPLRAIYPTRFFAYSPFVYIGSHPNLPYTQLSTYCDAVMPQAYWEQLFRTPQVVAADISSQWNGWQNNLPATNLNAIKPIVPLAQGWSPGPDMVTTGAQITQFSASLSSDPNPASPGGYNGVAYFRAELHSADMWSGITGVTFPVSFGQQPVTNTSIVAGQNVTLSALGTGTPPPVYQWRFNSTNIPGATTNTFNLTNVQPAQAGNYTVIISNSVNSASSSVAVVKVQSIAPVITNGPASQSVKLGSSAGFSVAASGTPPLSYQWLFNGTNISGATTSSYAIINARTTNAGNYSVIVTNGGGTNVSTNAVLSIVMPVAPHIDRFSSGAAGLGQLSISGDASTTYIVETSSNLVQWTPLATNSNISSSLLFTNLNTNSSRLFYRLHVAP